MASSSTSNRIARRISPAKAAALVNSGNWVDYGFGMGQPDAFDTALAARRDELEGVKVRACLSIKRRAVLEGDPEGRAFGMLNWHFGSYDRRMHDKGRTNYIPMNFGEAPDNYRRFIERVDVASLKECPGDANGFYNFGSAGTYHGAMMAKAAIRVIEVSNAMPYCAVLAPLLATDLAGLGRGFPH